MPQPGRQVLLQPAQHHVVVPRSIGEETLHPSGRYAHRLGKVLGVASVLGLHQHGLEVVPAALPRLPPAKQRTKVSVEIPEGLIHPLKRRRIHRLPPPPVAFANSPFILPFQLSL